METFFTEDTCTLNPSENSYTHYTSSNNKSWGVYKKSYEELYIKYCDICNDLDLDLCEYCPGNLVPVILEFNLSFQDMDDQPYDDIHQWNLISISQDVLNEVLHMKERSFTCCLMEADPIEKIDRSIYRLRLQFPFCNVNTYVAKNLIFPSLIDKLTESGFKFDLPMMNSWKESLNGEIYDHPISMLGSTSNNTEKRLKYKNLYGRITDEDIREYMIKKVRLNEVFDPSEHMFVIRDYMSADCFSNHSLEHWIPLFLSLEYSEKICEPLRRPKDMKTLTQDVTKMMEKSKNKELERCCMFINMWNRSRILMYDDWLKIGEALYNSDGAGLGCERWVRITENILRNVREEDVPDFLKDEYGIVDVDQACYSEYYIFPQKRITWKTLAKFASIDNPKRFKEWHNRWIHEAVEKCEECLESDVAEIFCRMYIFEFMTVYETRTPTVYFWQGHRWIKTTSPYCIRIKLKNQFADTIDQLITATRKKKTIESDEDKKASLIAREDLYREIYSKLKMKQFKNNLVQEINDNTVHEFLHLYMDMNSELLGVRNGVIVATKEEVTFREGIPEDYISLTTNVPYLEDLSWRSKSVKKVREWIRQIFLDNDTEHHFMKFLSSLIRGGNIDKKMAFLVGEFGNNAKSAFVRFVIKMFGPGYAIKLPTEILTRRSRSANGPTPAIARGRTARVAFLDEAGEVDDILSSLMKLYTGGDSIFARFLNKNGGDMILMCQLILVCNIPPNIRNAGPADISRTLIYPYETTWSENPDDVPDTVEERERQRKFQADRYFDDDIKKSTIALLWIMVEYYKYYVKEGLHSVPENMKVKAEKYWAQNDVYAQFTRENIEVIDDETEYVNLNDVYRRFKLWFRESYPETRMKSVRVVRNHLCMSWGEPENDPSLGGDVWFKMRFKSVGFEEDFSGAGMGRI